MGTSNLYNGSTYGPDFGINRDPGCSPRPRHGYYTRTGNPKDDPTADVRQSRLISFNNLIEPISPSNPNDGYTQISSYQGNPRFYYDQKVYRVITAFNDSTYGWDNDGISCDYQAPPGGDYNNSFGLVTYDSYIIASIEVSPTTIQPGDEITLTYYTFSRPENPNGVAGSRVYWARSSQSTSGTYNLNTYTFAPDADQTVFYIEIEDNDGNIIIDSCAINFVAAPTVTISTDAPVFTAQAKPRLLLGRSHNLTISAQASGTATIDNMTLSYPWPSPTTTQTFNGDGSNYLEETVTLTPTETTTYQVQATDSFGTVSSGKVQEVRVDNPPAPTVYFYVDNELADKTINIGESVVLRYWLVGNYQTSMYFSDGVTTTTYSGADLTIQQVTLAPTITTTYTVGGEGLGAYEATLTATPVSRTVTVISDPPQPYINASSITIINGYTTTLTYGATGTNINSMTLSYPGFSESYTDGTERTKLVQPTTTTTYTCSASNPAGSGTDATVTVTVLQPPTGSLTVDQPTTCPGVSRTFSYSVTGTFTSASINAPNGTQLVSITSPTTSTFTSSTPGTYTLSVIAGYGSGAYDVYDSASITELQTTTADIPGDGVLIYSGSNVTLSWYVQGSGVEVSLDQGIGVVSQNGFTTVTPTSDTTYTLTATGTCNTATDTYVVTVLPAPPSPTNPTLISDVESIIRGNPVRLDWQASAGGSSQTYSLTDYTGDPGSIGFDLFYPTDDKTYTYTVTKTYTSITYTNSNNLMGWVAPGVPCPSGQWKCGSNLPHPNGLLGDKCCQVVGTTNTSTETETASVSIIVYQPPVLTLNVLPTNTMIVGEERTLEWSVTGDADRLVWVEPFGAGKVPNTNLNSLYRVKPTVTTTYSAYPTGLGGIGNTESVTITVYQIPTLSVNWPTLIDFGSQTTIEYTSEFANTSVILNATYYYSDGSVTTSGPIELSHPDSAELGVGVTEVTDTYNTQIPWSSRGAVSIGYVMTANGSGGSVTSAGFLTANIDITPANFDIIDSVDLLADQQPVYTPNSEQLTDHYLIDDIDIEVEIKSNYPIQVQLNNSGTWENVREL